jgi:hypothetical protein
MTDKYWFHKKWGIKYEDTPTELLHNKIEQLELRIKNLEQENIETTNILYQILNRLDSMDQTEYTDINPITGDDQ